MRMFLFAAAVISGTAMAATTDSSPAANPAAAAAAEKPAGNTTVTFKDPDKYADARTDNTGLGMSKDVQQTLQAQIEKLGQQYLKQDQQLQITITDIDLAGRFDMTRPSARWVRVMRDVDWPRIDLHYKLTQNGQTVSEADAKLSDMNYQNDVRLQRSTEPLRYEKNLLSEWFEKTFGEKKK